VPSRDSEATARAIEKLILDEGLNHKIGKAGRERVKKLYNWTSNVDHMLSIYKDLRK